MTVPPVPPDLPCPGRAPTAVRLTETQTETLRILRHAARPLTAYEVLEALRRVRRTAAPPTAYRALGRLIELGLAHRVESLSAYVVCCADHGAGAAAFSICDTCGSVDEVTEPRLSDGIAAAARRGGFAAEKSVVELHGRCAQCRGAT